MNRSGKFRQLVEEIEPGVAYPKNGRLYAENKHLHEEQEYQIGGATFRVVAFFNAIAAFVCNLFTNKK